MQKEKIKKIIEAIENNNKVVIKGRDYDMYEVACWYDDEDNAIGLVIDYDYGDGYNHSFNDLEVSWEELFEDEFELFIETKTYTKVIL